MHSCSWEQTRGPCRKQAIFKPSTFIFLGKGGTWSLRLPQLGASDSSGDPSFSLLWVKKNQKPQAPELLRPLLRLCHAAAGGFQAAQSWDLGNCHSIPS